jgi:hypothetical protein
VYLPSHVRLGEKVKFKKKYKIRNVRQKEEPSMGAQRVEPEAIKVRGNYSSSAKPGLEVALA